MTTFGCFTTEMWRTTGNVGRGRMWLVIGVFAVLAVLFLCSVLPGELRSLPDDAFADLATDAVEPGAPAPRLTRLERST